MSKMSLRSRVAKRGEIRYLSNGESEALFAAKKTIDLPVSWQRSDARHVRMSVPVTNSLGENLKITGRISGRWPGKSGWTLIWGRKDASEHPASIRRLDLRGSHKNPDRELWNATTHKHRWSEADGNSWAYTPDDIPHDSAGTSVTIDDYRVVFEAFAAECFIELGPAYAWEAPDFGPLSENLGIWEVT